jgi:Cysteine-rich secretory protein family
LRARIPSVVLPHLDVPLLGVVVGWAFVVAMALALCRAAAAGDRVTRRPAPATRRAANPDAFVPRTSLVVVLAVTVLALMSSPAWATVRRVGRTVERAGSARRIPGACLDAGLWPSGTDLGLIRAVTLCLVNRERAEAGERPLSPNMRLQHAAQAHTDNMAVRDYFEHDGPRGDTPLSRVRASGYLLSSRLSYEVGENIGWGTLWEGTPQAVVAAWMASPGHRANILDPRFRNTGIGVSVHPPFSLARGQAGAIYTQDFGGY